MPATVESFGFRSSKSFFASDLLECHSLVLWSGGIFGQDPYCYHIKLAFFYIKLRLYPIEIADSVSKTRRITKIIEILKRKSRIA